MPTDVLNVPPVIAETIDSVRARFDADATAGLDPSDPRYPDLTVGGMYWDNTQPSVIEAVRLWDSLTEMIAAAFPGSSWGEYLDMAGETINVPRNDEVAATGEVTFSGVVGTPIPSGTVVSTVVLDPSSGQIAQEFETTESITLAPTPGPTGLSAVVAASGGSLPAGVYYYEVSAVVGGVETVSTGEVSAVTSGSASKVTLTWSAVGGATSYRVYRASVTGQELLMLDTGSTTASFVDDGSITITSTQTPSTNRTGVVASVLGSAGNVAAGTISLVQSPLTNGPSVTNTAATSGGADVESDDHYRGRILLAYGSARGGGTQADYVAWALQDPSIGFVTVDPLWAGAGTVRVVITDPQNHPSSAVVVNRLQNRLDPVPGEGEGLAPIGAVVTVATVTTDTITVAGTVIFEAGFSLDGAGGTAAIQREILDAIETYVNTLPPGGDVILYKVIGQMIAVPGVADVSGVTLNGSAANVAVAALQVANTDDAHIALS